MAKTKYKKGDIVGVCCDRMYEFEIDYYDKDQKMYAAKCTKVAGEEDALIKVGEIRGLKASQVVVKLGEDGKKWPV